MPTAPPTQLYGRRIGKPLSPRRVGLMADVFPKLALDPSQPPPARAAELFPGTPSVVHLEVGFGGGEHLVGEAARARGEGFIGVEPFANGMAKAVAAIVADGLTNIRLFGGDAGDLLDWLPPASLATADILFPDPWPKKRHWKRRFVSAANLNRLARAMMPGAVLHVASDIPAYIEWTLAQVAPRSDFAWTADKSDDWRKPFSGWIPTRYEQKALRAGRTPTYLEFRRT